jgi:hypothetical protein
MQRHQETGYKPVGSRRMPQRNPRDAELWRIFDWATTLSDTELRVLCAWVMNPRLEQPTRSRVDSYFVRSAIADPLKLMLAERIKLVAGLNGDPDVGTGPEDLERMMYTSIAVRRVYTMLYFAMAVAAMAESVDQQYDAEISDRYSDACNLIELTRGRELSEELLCALAMTWNGSPADLVQCTSVVSL